MLFQEAPAATTNYMIAGYAVLFGVLLLYFVSLVFRQKNLEKDLEILQEQATDDKSLQ
jgi:hypothetical protein